MLTPESPALAAHRVLLAAWRAKSTEEQRAAFGRPPLGPPPDGRARVGLLCPCFNMGGAEAHQLMLARTCDPGRVAWVGCCVVDPGAALDPAMRLMTEEWMPVTQGPPAARALAERCDVLVTWSIRGMDRLLAGLAGPPKVVAVSHSPVESPWGVDHNAAVSGVDRWVAVSELALPAIPEAARAAIPTSVIGNAVDVDRLAVNRSREAMRASWGVPPGAKVAGFLGRLSAEKDPDAMRRLIGYLPANWHGVVVGSGQEQLEPRDRLHLAGVDPAAGDVLNAFDVLLVPSRYESFGLTLAEGLWMGVPVVSTPVGIARLRPGLTYPVPVGADGHTLASAVLRAHASGPRHGSREWAREHLAPDRFGREWTELICSLAETRSNSIQLDPTRPEPPGLARQAASLVKAVIGHAAAGGRLAPPEVQEARAAICNACPNLGPGGNICLLCGCGLSLKRSWASSVCPDNPPRWEAV